MTNTEQLRGPISDTRAITMDAVDALDMITRMLPGDEAAALGWATRAIADLESALTEARDLAGRLLERPNAA